MKREERKERKMPQVNQSLNEDYLVLSEAYQRVMDEYVIPELKGIRRDTFVLGARGDRIFCSCFDVQDSRGTVVILHGFTESVEKFDELIYSLVKHHYSVCAYDQRGHGRSAHAEGLPDDSVTHVDAFDEYVRDLEQVLDQVVSKMPAPYLLFSHSMGGAVSALYLEGHAEPFERAVFCAPMIACDRGGLPMLLAKGICLFPCAVGRGKARNFIAKPYAGPEDFETSCASCKERFERYNRFRAEHREFQNSGPTYRWTLEALRVTARILAPGAVEKIRIPVLLYTAGKDNMVLPEQQRLFVERLPKGKQVLVPGAKHEIYFSEDDVLFPWWRQILAFFAGEK